MHNDEKSFITENPSILLIKLNKGLIIENDFLKKEIQPDIIFTEGNPESNQL